jgi:hypothetical protein
LTKEEYLREPSSPPVSLSRHRVGDNKEIQRTTAGPLEVARFINNSSVLIDRPKV